MLLSCSHFDRIYRVEANNTAQNHAHYGHIDPLQCIRHYYNYVGLWHR